MKPSAPSPMARPSPCCLLGLGWLLASLSGCGGFAVTPSLRAPRERWHTQFPPHSTLWAVHEHTQAGILKPEPRLVPLTSREDFGLTLAFFDKSWEGRRLFYFFL